MSQAHRWTLAIGAADLNHDRLPELYFANDSGPDTLFLNRSTPGNVRLLELHGRWSLASRSRRCSATIRSEEHGRRFRRDINNDGNPDMFVSNLTGEWQLERATSCG